MDLPIFSDNLKSSASWADMLARARAGWDEAHQSSETRDRIITLIRRDQVEQALRRAGEGIDEQQLYEAAKMVSSWAGEPEARFDFERLLDLHRTVTGAAQDTDVLRKTEPLPINAMHDPTPALLLPRMLDNAFDWFNTESFKDL